jgi:predicted enzyme related to lactoylglutathione lyase
MRYQGFVWSGIHVEDMAEMICFYEDVLGLPLLGQDEGWAHFDAGDGALLELFSGGQRSHTVKKPSEQSIAIGLRVADLAQAVEELERKEVHFIGDTGEYEDTRWRRFSDPEGNRLEIKEVPSVQQQQPGRLS